MALENPIKILLIEDDAGDARLIREMLLRGPQETFALNITATLREGLEACHHEPCDVILLDLSLPDSYGLDTVLQVRAQAPQTAIVVLTGLDDQQTGIRAVKAGAQDYLSKGDVDQKVLTRSIRYAIERHNAEMALRRSEEAYRSLIDDVFDTSMVAVIILDKDLMVVWSNEATEIYFGVQRATLLGRDKRLLIDEELKYVFADPDDYAARLLKAYKAHAFTDRFECHVLPAENRDERWLEHWSQPIRDGRFKEGRIEQYTDITDRKMLEFAEREQRQFAEALRNIAEALTSTLDLDRLLDRVLENIKLVIPNDAATITLFDSTGPQVARRRSGQQFRQLEAAITQYLQNEGVSLLNRPAEDQAIVYISDLQQAPPYLRGAAAQANIHAYVALPIQLQDETLGFINIFADRADAFPKAVTERLLAFAKPVAIAIQNAQLYERSQELAALEERQRLARELHDSVSQTLFTCRTMAESALRRWDRDSDRSRELVEEIYQLTMTALTEMRILLLELRPAALSQIGLKQLLEQYLKPIQDRRKYDLSLSIDEISPLPPNVQLALYRIVQETLNNIDKHAQATRVEVHIREQPDQLELAIRDNGIGFEIPDVAVTSLGLEIMRERAREIGASIQIETGIGQGTQITIRWQKPKGDSND